MTPGERIPTLDLCHSEVAYAGILDDRLRHHIGMPQDPEAATRLVLRLVGEPSLAGSDRRPRLLERRDAALLALLVLEGPQPRAQLGRWLWPTAEPAAALRNLRQRFFRLARGCGAAVVEGQASVRLCNAVSHDLDPVHAVAQGLEGGSLLGAFDYDDCEPLAERVEALRARWLRLCTDALERALDAAERGQRLEDALSLAERMLLLQPQSDRAWERLLRLHLVRGEPIQGLAVYERCARMQRRGSGEPGPALRQLARQLRDAAALRPVAASLRLAQPPRLVGRDADWALLRDAWQAHCVIVLRGAPGIGKSRFATEFSRAAGSVLALKAIEDQQSEVYGLLVRLWVAAAPRLPQAADWASTLLSSLMASAGPAAGAALPEHRIQEAVRTALSPWSAAGLGALLLDDLQWADAASLEAILAWLHDAEPRPPVLLVLRSGEPSAPLERWLDRLPRGGWIDHTLGPLDGVVLHEFVRSLELPDVDPERAGVVAAGLQRAVGGHPFLMLELLRGGTVEFADRESASASTPRLLHAIGRRIVGLAPAPLRLLRLAALAAGDFSVPLAAEVLGVHAVDLVDHWSTLTAAGFMQEDGTVFDLVVETARRSVPEPIARELHRQLAEHGSRRGARPERLAEHWCAAGRWAEAGACFEAAARAAEALSRHGDALLLWDRAADSHGRAGDAEARWRAWIGGAETASGCDGGAEWVRRTRALVHADAPTPLDRIDAWVQHGNAVVNSLADPSEAQAVLEQAVDAAVACSDGPRCVAAAGLLILTLAILGRHDDARQLIERHDEVAMRLPPCRATWMYFGPKGVALYYAGEFGASLQATARAAEHAHASGHPLAELNERSSLGLIHRAMGRSDAAAEQYGLALDLWQRLHQPRNTSSMSLLLNVAMLDIDGGRFDRALSLAALARDHFAATRSADWQVVAEARLFTAYVRLGQFARARQALSPLPEDTGVDRRVGRLMQHSRLAQAAGEAVVNALRQAVADDGPKLMRRNQLTLRAQLAEAVPAAESLQLAEGVLADAQAWNDSAMHAAACALMADALRRLGRTDAAARLARRAWDEAARYGLYGMSHVELCWRVHQAALAGRDLELAATSLASGERWIEAAMPHVPPTFVESFRHRQPVNRALLARAAARRIGSVVT